MAGENSGSAASVVAMPEQPRSAPASEWVQLEPLPHGGAFPPRLFSNRPFLWLVASYGVEQLAFWGFFLAVMGEAGYRFHATAGQLGILLAAYSVVFIPLTVPFGMAVDRWSPKWMLVLAIIPSVACVLVALSARSVWWLCLAFAIDGVVAAMLIPGRGSLTALLVDRDQLVRANGALNAAAMTALVAGPALAGLLERHGGFHTVYWYVLGGMFAAVLLLLALPDRRPRPEDSGEETAPGFVAGLVEGFGVSWRIPELRALIVLASAAWFFTTVLIALEPLFVNHVLGRGVDVLGYLWAASGAGSVVGAVMVARSRRASGREVGLIGLSLVVAGAGFALYVGTAFLGPALAGTVVFGVGFAWYMSLAQALIQRVTQERLRGRVTGVVGTLQEGAALIGSLAIAAAGGLIVDVQPYLFGSAVVMIGFGVFGLMAGRRIAAGRRAGRPERAPAV